MKLMHAFKQVTSVLVAKLVSLVVLEAVMDCNVMLAHWESGQLLEENVRTAVQVDKAHSCRWLSLWGASD